MVGFAQFLNPAHGSGRIVQVLSKTNTQKGGLIPPTAVGGYFKSFLKPTQKGRSNPANGSWRILQGLAIYKSGSAHK